MILTEFSKMLFSSHAGWQEVDRIHPSVEKLFLSLVLPMSLLPPAMIAYAGFNYGNEYFATGSSLNWVTSACVFLIAELLSVPLMAWAIKNIAATRNIHTDYHDTFVVATVAVIPLWLSSLALFVSSPLFIVGMALVGLLISVSAIYHGITGLLHVHDEIEVESITYTTICLGVATWTLLIVLIFLPFI